MTPEEIARKHEKLAGFDLVDYSEIALPLWQMSVEALSLAHRRFQPILEYVLRTVQHGMSIDDTAGFLGLELDVVRGALAQLAADRLVLSEGGLLALSDRGRKALAEDGIQLPIEEQLPILFDGLSRRPALKEPEDIVLGRDIEEGVVVEIPSIPANRPTISELNLADVVHFLSRQSGGRREMGRDILRLKRISRSRRIFQRAIGLVFKAHVGKELRVHFVVDGAIDEQLQNQFAAGGGTSRPGFVRSFSDSYVSANVRRHLGQEASRIPLDLPEYERLQVRLSVAKLRKSMLLRKAQLVSTGVLSDRDMPPNQVVESANDEENESLNALKEDPVRPATVYECVELLGAALRTANSSISISSRGLAPHIVDSRFLQSLRRAVSKGVKINIFLHEDSFEWPKRGPGWSRAYTQLNDLCREYSDFIQVNRSRENRFFHVSWDNRIALVCNRPLLSNHGRVKAFEQFAGFVLQRDDLVEAYLQRVVGQRG
jgi:hypothetical protein